MKGAKEWFLLASALDSWGVLDYPGASWEQSYEKMLDDMEAAGYTRSELGPYGFFPTDPEVLRRQFGERVQVGKQAYQVFRERGYRIRLLSAAFRNPMH